MFVLIGFSYVDECDLIQTGQDAVEVLTSMQQVVDSWTDQVKVTLKKLVLPCGLQDVTRTVENLRPTLPFNLFQRLPCDKASEMLGIYMALRKKAVDWASRIRLGRASPQVAWTALHTTISAKLKYALSVCTFNEAKCNKIMAPAIMARLPIKSY
jgi:hypothetical protein